VHLKVQPQILQLNRNPAVVVMCKCALTYTLVNGYARYKPWKGVITTTMAKVTIHGRTIFVHLKGQPQILQLNRNPAVVVMRKCALTYTSFNGYARYKPWKGVIITTLATVTIHGRTIFLHLKGQPQILQLNRNPAVLASSSAQGCIDLHII
jgi:hypothetical protein